MVDEQSTKPVAGYSRVAFLSDYGLGSHMPACVRSQILSETVDVEITDITHGIKPFDVRTAAYVLCDVAASLRPGVVLAIVDAHIDAGRRAVAVSVGSGESVLVGPDNGLLAPVVAMAGGADRAVVLNDDRSSRGLGTNGIGLFAPAVSALCASGSLDDIGKPVDLDELAPGVMTFGSEKASLIQTSVLFIDEFGNVVLDCDASLVEGAKSLSVQNRERKITSDVDPNGSSQLIHFENRLGLLSLALPGARADKLLNCEVGDEISIRRQLI